MPKIEPNVKKNKPAKKFHPDPRPNVKHLTSGAYLVRTQAGFRKAAMHFFNVLHSEDSFVPSDLKVFPSKYPSVCFFECGYDGLLIPEATIVPLKTYKDSLNMLLNELKGE